MIQNPVRHAARRYYWQFGISMATYVIVLFTIVRLIAVGAITGAWRYPVLLLPVIPVVFLFVAMARFLGATDELDRRVTLEALGIAAGITAILAVTYGFLEMAGLPHLSAWWTWMVLMLSWGIAKPFVAGQYR